MDAPKTAAGAAVTGYTNDNKTKVGNVYLGLTHTF